MMRFPQYLRKVVLQAALVGFILSAIVDALIYLVVSLAGGDTAALTFTVLLTVCAITSVFLCLMGTSGYLHDGSYLREVIRDFYKNRWTW